MDFTKLGALLDEQETWLHLEVGGKPLYLDEGGATITPNQTPCRVLVKGVSAPAVVKAIKKIELSQLNHETEIRLAKNRKQREQLNAEFAKKMERMMTHTVAISIVDWENVHEEYEPVDTDSVNRLVNPETAENEKTEVMITAIRGQIYQHITEQRSLFTDAARD